MDKQDLNGTRTAQNIEQKYNLGAINSIIKTLKDNEQVLASLGLDLSSLNEALEDTQSDLSNTKTSLQQTQTDLSNTKTSLQQTQNDLTTTNNNLATTNSNLATTNQNLATTNQNLATTNQNLATTNTNLASTNEELAQAKEDISQTQSDLADTNSTLSDTNEDLAQAKQDIIQTQSDLADTNTALNATNGELAQAKTDLINTNTTLGNFISATNSSIQTLQGEIDGSITTFFHANAPTMNNYPVTEWAQADYPKHLGDLYYDTETGYAYRFYVENNVYGWDKISDTDVTRALALANSAQDTADNKRRVFLTQPEPPYDSGDLWVNQGEIYVCQISRESGNYQPDDFVDNLMYTDDTYARAINDTLTQEISVERGRITTLSTTTDAFKVSVESSISTLQNDTKDVIDAVRYMDFTFGTDNLTISNSESPNNMRINNEGLKVYNYNNLIAIFNKNGSGIDKLIATKSIQLQNILLKPREIVRPDTGQTIKVVSCFWLINNIENLHSLEVD